MLYVNNSDQRKRVTQKMMKVWVQPGQTIELNSNDRRVLGFNAASVVPVEADAPAQKPTKKKAAKKAAVKAPEMNDKEARKALSESFNGFRKDRLIEIGENVLKVDVKNRDPKGKIIKQLLKASKTKGYAWVLKNT